MRDPDMTSGRMLGVISIALFLVGVAAYLLFAFLHKPVVLFGNTMFYVEVLLYAAGFVVGVAGLFSHPQKASKVLCTVGAACKNDTLSR